MPLATARPKYYEYSETALATALPPATPADGGGFTPGAETPIASLVLDEIKQNDRQLLYLTVNYSLSATLTLAALPAVTGVSLSPSAQVIFRIYRDAPSIALGGTQVVEFVDTITGGTSISVATPVAFSTTGSTTITGTDDNAPPPLGEKSGSHEYFATAQVLSFGLVNITLPVVGALTVAASAVTIDSPLHLGGMVIDENEFN